MNRLCVAANFNDENCAVFFKTIVESGLKHPNSIICFNECGKIFGCILNNRLIDEDLMNAPLDKLKDLTLSAETKNVSIFQKMFAINLPMSF